MADEPEQTQEPKHDVPARLFVIPAREAPKAVILRRGPSKWVELILWHTDTDTFDRGQWFKGRIHERRCDLSPDGSLFVYFAQKIEARTLQDTEYTYAWTAISKPPYLTALALWPKGDCWHGGGLFLDARTVWLNHKPEVARPHTDHKPKGLKIIPNPEAQGEDEPIYYKRLERDGWPQIQEGKLRDIGYWNAPWSGNWSAPWVLGRQQVNTWEKPRHDGRYSLLMKLVAVYYSRPGGARVDEFWLLNKQTSQQTLIEGANWADWDQRGRLVFTKGGQLFASEDDLPNPKLLADFNMDRHRPVVTPDWARHW